MKQLHPSGFSSDSALAASRDVLVWIKIFFLFSSPFFLYFLRYFFSQFAPLACLSSSQDQPTTPLNIKRSFAPLALVYYEYEIMTL